MALTKIPHSLCKIASMMQDAPAAVSAAGNQSETYGTPGGMPVGRGALAKTVETTKAKLSTSGAGVTAIRFGAYDLDRAAEQLRRNGEPVFLRPKAWQVLCHLVENPGRLVSTDELLDAAWPGTAVTPNTLTNVIGELRKALDDCTETPHSIETVHRRGYRFIARVRVEPSIPSTDSTPPLSTRHLGSSAEEPVLNPSLIGRGSELAELHTMWQRAVVGKRQAVFVTGEPGIGKTTLVEACLAALSHTPTPPHIARAQCIEQHGTSEAYLPILDLVERLARDSDGETFVSLLQQHAPTWLAQISSLLPAAEMQRLRTSLAGLGAQRMLREGVALFDRLSERWPLLVVIEDLHWSDAGTLAWIAALAQRNSPARLMLLLSYRPVDAVVQQHRVVSVAQQLRLHQHARQLALAPFSSDEVRFYVDQRFPDTDAGALLAPLIERHSGGNPLFVDALLTHLQARDWLQQHDGHWVLAADVETCDIGLPEDIRSAIEAQLAALPPRFLELLEAASVEGEDFSVRGVAAAVSSPAEHVEDALHQMALQHQLIHRSEGRHWPDGQANIRYRFSHVLYRRAVYEHLAPSRRRQLHRSIGECLEGAYGDRAGEIAAQLLTHFEAADDVERRVRYRSLAAATASLRFAHTDAVEHLTEALAQAQRLPRTQERLRQEADLELRLGNALMAAHGGVDLRIHAAFARAEALAREGHAHRERFRALIGLGSTFRLHGGVEAFESPVRQMLAMAGSVIPSLAAQAHWQAGELQLAKAELRSAREHFEQSLQGDGEPGIPVFIDFRSLAEIELAMVLTQLGFLDQGRQWVDSALQRSAAAGLPFSDCQVTWLAVIVSQMQRDSERKWIFADQCAAKAEPFGFVTYSTIDFWRLRRDACGTDSFGEILRSNQAISGRWYDSFYYAEAAEAFLATGDGDTALEYVGKGFDDMAELGQRWYEAELWRLKGEALRQKSRAGQTRPKKTGKHAPAGYVEAETCFRTAIDIARRQEAKLWELRASTSLGHLLQQQGERDEARSLVTEILAWFSEGFEATDLHAARALLAQL